MDSAADGLLALSNTAAAMAESVDQIEDDRSSSLSELDYPPENPEDQDPDQDADEDMDGNATLTLADGDSEAETERLEESPDKMKRQTFQTSPSKLAQSMTADDRRPEIEALTNSDVSSPITPVENSPLEELSDAEDLPEQDALALLSQVASNKRKRLSDVMDLDGERPRKRRTESVDSEDEKSEPDSDLDVPDGDVDPEIATRDPSPEPDLPEPQPESEVEDEVEAEEQPAPDTEEQVESSDALKLKKPTRSRSSRRGKELLQDEDDNDATNATDDEAEVDDVEAVVKSEEDQAKRASAMDSLSALESHFATLRDRIYNEQFASLDRELAQLAEAEICHPELLKQVECVHKYRDQKQDMEQKLLVFKIGALKRKSVAERATTHSSYFQAVRDLRERHLENISEKFYRIQRERFKSTKVTPTFTVPFPEKRLQQVTQQLAYNKEVSILSGIGKYVGFPAAPDLPSVVSSDLESDMQKMGVQLVPARLPRTVQRPLSTFTSSIPAGGAEEQFLEQTPWANPNHPIHRLGRQNHSRSPLHASSQPNNTTQTSYLATPAAQQSTTDIHAPIGSSSTIVENPSAPASSALNTPHDLHNTYASANNHIPNGINALNIAMSMSAPLTNANTTTHQPTNGRQRQDSTSPTNTRHFLASLTQAATAAAQASSNNKLAYADSPSVGFGGVPANGLTSSPLQARAVALGLGDRRDETRSPFRRDLGHPTTGGNGVRLWGS